MNHKAGTDSVRLDLYDNSKFDRGAGRIRETLWLLCSWLCFSWRFPGRRTRVAVVRMFGASVGRGVYLQPGVRIKFPWRLTIGDHSWIGQDVWLDNLAPVSIGSHCCVSQGAYVCTGSHDWKSETFDLVVKPVVIGDGAWIGAGASVAPGVTIGQAAVLTLGSVATWDLDAGWIYQGNPAAPVRERVESCDDDPLMRPDEGFRNDF